MNKLQITEIVGITKEVKKEISLVKLTFRVGKNALNFERKQSSFRRVMLSDTELFIQGQTGYIYTATGDEKDLILKFIKENDILVLSNLLYDRTPLDQLTVLEKKESSLLKEEYKSGDTLILPPMKSFKISDDLLSNQFAFKSDYSSVDKGIMSLKDLVHKINKDDRYNNYSEFNTLDLKDSTINIAEHYMYTIAKDVESLFINENDKNKTIAFLGLGNEFFVANKILDSDNSIIKREIYNSIYNFQRNQGDSSVVEVELIDGEYFVTALYVKSGCYSWAKIDIEHADSYNFTDDV